MSAWGCLIEGCGRVAEYFCVCFRIPRAEVEEIGRCVKENLDALLPGCRYTLTGG